MDTAVDGRVKNTIFCELNFFIMRKYEIFAINPPLLAYVKLQPLSAPLVILNEPPSLLAPVDKMTTDKFQLRLG